MRITAILVLLTMLLTRSLAQGQPVPADGRAVQSVPAADVKIDAGFWRTWQEINAKKILPYVLGGLLRSGHIDNFSKAAGQLTGPTRGEAYYDSDVYKWIEGASASLALFPDATLEKSVKSLIERIEVAQQADGYLHTYTTVNRPLDRWKHSQWHEHYCAGHLFEAAATRLAATRDDDLYRVARGLADQYHRVRSDGQEQLRCPPEHQEIELGLLRIYGISRDERDLRLAEFFLEQRGRFADRKSFGDYAQDHRPVGEQFEAVGHSVRAAYMYSAMADLVALTGNPAYRSALDRIFQDLVRGKVHVSGGVGLLRSGDTHESFSPAFDLPIDQPDVDTCSVIGLVFWLHRMNLIEPDGRYGDLIERMLYNRLLVGVSLDGTRYFYGCPLVCAGPGHFNAGPGAEVDTRHCRPKWFSCVCCPTNIPRLLATVGGYALAANDRQLYVNQYLPSQSTVAMGQRKIGVDIATQYPWEGRIKIALRPEQPREFELALRIPGWASGDEFPSGLYRGTTPVEQVGIKINGRLMDAPAIQRGFARITRLWKTGDIVELELPMPIRQVEADPRVQAAAGRVALMRGPILYCLEAVDHGGRVSDLLLDSDAELTAELRPDLLGGVVVIRGARALHRLRTEQATNGHASLAEQALLAIPYYAWDNRTPGEMAAWIPVSKK